MLYLGTLITAASGRLNGSVFSRNRGGPYIRAWVQPDETPTTERQAVWDAMASIADHWPSLAPEQRQGWAAYSLTHHRPNRLGIPRPVGAFQEFTRANFPARQAVQLLGSSYDWKDNPPADDEVAPVSPVAFGIHLDGPSTVLTIDAPAEAGYQGSDQAGLNVYIADPVSGNRHSWPGPYTLVQSIAAPAAGGVVEYVIPSPGTTGQALFVRARYFTAAGRLTMTQRARLLYP